VDILTRTEEAILLAIYQLGDNAYGVTIRQQLEVMIGKGVSVGAVYVPLARLTRRGLLTATVGDPTPERGGRRKRFYRITPAGLLALKKTKRLHDAMWARLPDPEKLTSTVS